MTKWLFFLSLLVSTAAPAAILDFKPLALPVQARDQLLIKGFDGDVKLNVIKASQITVKVRQETNDKVSGIVRQTMDEWNISLQRGAQGIELVVQAPQAKEAWRQLVKTTGVVKFHLEVSGPALPLEMAWRSGKVNLESWSAPIKLTLQEGLIQLNGGNGDARLVGQEVDIRVRNRTGRIAAESYSGKINLDTVKGNLDIENFTGDTQVSGNEGYIEFRSFKSPLTVTGGRGRVEFSSTRGPIKLTGFNGDLKGISDEASVTAKLTGAAEVRVTTQSGPVSLDLPDSSASVSAASAEGPIVGPSHMRADQLVGQRVMRGRLRGSVDGSIVVRTQSGAIRIR